MLRAVQDKLKNITRTAVNIEKSRGFFPCGFLWQQNRAAWFSTSKSALIESEQTFSLIVEHMREKMQYVSSLEKTLIEETNKVNSGVNKEKLRIEISKLTPIINAYQDVTNYEQNINDLQEMLRETKDKQEKDLLNQELQESLSALQELKEKCFQLLVPETPYDKADDILLEFRPGAGGSQSCIFVQDISQMYQSFASTQGWKCSTSSAVKEAGVNKGYKQLDLRVQGEGCHKMMKCEAGVHKVIRVPETETKGRLHSSTISLVVMPVVPFTFELDPKDIKYQFTRSSGPGGQGVNKIQSACRAIHIPTGLAVFIQEERSQDTNKKRATQILKQKLFQMQYKKAMEQQKSNRKSQVTTMDRSQKIRTYNYPQDRITDHRTGLTKFGINSMMNGQMLEEFIDSYIETVDREKVEALVLELYERAGITPPK